MTLTTHFGKTSGYRTGSVLHPIVQLEAISRVYGTGEAMVKACDNISLTIHQGEYCAIMGESGSGKSTLMNIIGCLDRPTHGQYLLNGLNVSRFSKNRLARIRNRYLGFVFQRYELLNNLTALENVILPMMYTGISRRKRRQLAIAALTQMGLGHRLDKRPSQLSGGQQQRVAIARAIVNRPLLLLADEPTGALDSQSAEAMMDIFKALHKAGMTIVMVTHSHDVACHSDRIIQVSDGHIMDAYSHPQDLSV
jgi:putative ABC transport system ATP-binding protein